MSSDPSVDPRPTIDYLKSPAEPGTVDDTGAYDPAPATASAAKHATSDDWPKIAGYEITAEIAKGGMGRVFVGRELSLDREIAVKTLLPGADAERFATESKITARLPHPGIPPVHALGALADGAPYLVMKLIRGRTLADSLKKRTSPADDLSRWVQVFEQIAQAVGFAHAQGIIHRDLKPANVMVGAFGEVQVMDWGLAKELQNRERKRTDDPMAVVVPQPEITHAGTILGTPGYMAPEQARGEVVDARADVFALGAILTVILTGNPPIAGTSVRETIEKAAAGNLADALSRLDGCGADKELITLAKSCLAPAAPDRLADARLIAEQVAAYRAGVEARLRQAETERAAALVREAESRKRRRLRQAVAVVLVIGIIGTSIGMLSASNEAHEKAQALIREGEALKKEKERADSEAKAVEAEKAANIKERAATVVAVTRLTEIQKANDRLQSIFADIDPQLEQKGGPLLVDQLRKRLVNIAVELEEDAIADAHTTARLQGFLGNTLTSLGEPTKAIDLYQKALGTWEKLAGPDHPDTLATMNGLAVAYSQTEQHAKAIQLAEETLARRKANLGPDHVDTLNSLANLAAAYQLGGQLAKALPLFEETLAIRKAKLGHDHPDTLTSMNNLAVVYRNNSRMTEALLLYEETLLKRTTTLGPDHPDTLSSMNNLAAAYFEDGQKPKALSLHKEALAKRKAKLGPDHPDTLTSMNGLANAYRDAGDLSEALPLFEEALAKRKAKLNPDHPDILESINNLAATHLDAGQVAKALPLFEETVAKTKVKLGPDRPETLVVMSNLAEAYRAAGQVAKALVIHEETVAKMKANLGPDHPKTLMCINNLAWTYKTDGQLAKALALLEDTLAKRKAKLGPNHPETLRSMRNLALAYEAHGDFALAAGAFEEHLSQRMKKPPNGPMTSKEINNLANQQDECGYCYLRAKNYAAAEKWLRLSLAAFEERIPDSWGTFDTRSMLGHSLLGQKNYEDAEPLLKEGYAGMKAREKTIPNPFKPRLVEAAQRLVQFYEATDRKAEAEKWAKVVAAYRGQDGKLLDAIHDIGQELKLTGKLDADTSALIYQVRLKSGVTYVIDMVSPDQKALDPYLYLRDAKDNLLAEDDDSGGGLNARITYPVNSDGVYRIRATSFNNGRGDFMLTVRRKD